MKTIEKIHNALNDLFNRRYFFGWLTLFLKKSNPVKEQIPFIPFKAQEWLNRFLKANMCVFEYGSGGSTIFIAKRVKSLVSIEHDKKWYQHVREALNSNAIQNCEYFLIEPEYKDSKFIQSHKTSNQLLYENPRSP